MIRQNKQDYQDQKDECGREKMLILNSKTVNFLRLIKSQLNVFKGLFWIIGNWLQITKDLRVFSVNFANWCKNSAKNCRHYFKYQHKQTVRLWAVALINSAILPEAISLTARDSHFCTGNFISLTTYKQHHIS